MIAVNKVRFDLGRVLTTPGALHALERADQSPWTLLSQHIAGEWGIVDDEDKRANDNALNDGSRLLSAYILNDGITKVWIITEAKNDHGVREATTILLPEEY
jgi:hypothetical protein